MHTGKDLGAH